MRQITSSTLSNQSLATALNVHTYTADADRMLFIRCFVDQVAGNGAYSAYVTIQRLGAGSFYEVQPRTAPTVASGVTSIGFTTIPIPVKNTDVVKVYVLGLAGDTTTPDIITEIWEDDSLCPTTAGNKLDVSSGGEAGIDWGNVGSPTSTVALTGTTAGLINGAITAAKFGTDAIDANALKADAVTEIQSGLGTAASQTTIINMLTAIASYIDTEVASILTQVGSTGVVLSTATKQAIADEVLKRGMANVDSASPDVLSLYHLIAAILNGSMQGGLWTAHKSTGGTFTTSTLTTDDAALPVTAVAS